MDIIASGWLFAMSIVSIKDGEEGFVAYVVSSIRIGLPMGLAMFFLFNAIKELIK